LKVRGPPSSLGETVTKQVASGTTMSRTLGASEAAEEIGHDRVLESHVLRPEVRDIQEPNETQASLKRTLVALGVESGRIYHTPSNILTRFSRQMSVPMQC